MSVDAEQARKNMGLALAIQTERLSIEKQKAESYRVALRELADAIPPLLDHVRQFAYYDAARDERERVLRAALVRALMVLNTPEKEGVEDANTSTTA